MAGTSLFFQVHLPLIRMLSRVYFMFFRAKNSGIFPQKSSVGKRQRFLFQRFSLFSDLIYLLQGDMVVPINLMRRMECTIGLLSKALLQAHGQFSFLIFPLFLSSMGKGLSQCFEQKLSNGFMYQTCFLVHVLGWSNFFSVQSTCVSQKCVFCGSSSITPCMVLLPGKVMAVKLEVAAALCNRCSRHCYIQHHLASDVQ